MILDTLSEAERDLVKKCNEVAVLTKLLDCDKKRLFQDPFLSREQYSFVLGINRATLYRWQAILRSDRTLSLLYKECGKPLTAHQGFFLYLFAEFKKFHSYEEVILQFKSPYQGKPFWYWITKEKFKKWQEDVSPATAQDTKQKMSTPTAPTAKAAAK